MLSCSGYSSSWNLLSRWSIHHVYCTTFNNVTLRLLVVNEYCLYTYWIDGIPVVVLRLEIQWINMAADWGHAKLSRLATEGIVIFVDVAWLSYSFSALHFSMWENFSNRLSQRWLFSDHQHHHHDSCCWLRSRR